MYGSGLRVMETLRLRVMDIDFDQNKICIRDGKGKKDRILPLPSSIVQELHLHIQQLSIRWQRERSLDLPGVSLPERYTNTIPHAAKEWQWYYLFPSYAISTDPRTDLRRRHHAHGSGLRRRRR